MRDGNIGDALSRTTSGGTYYYHYDGNGNVVAMTNTSGTIVAEYTYDAYGNVTSMSGSEAADNPIRFSTKYFDGDTGYYDFGFRSYDPVTGRWLNRDPIGEEGGLNLYGFVGNSPGNIVDSYGMRPLTSEDMRRLHSLPYGGSLTSLVNGAIRAIKQAIAAVPSGQKDPPNLQALWWAIDQLGNTDYGHSGIVTEGNVSTYPADEWKCNVFVGNAYAIGTGVGYGGVNGYPANKSWFGGGFLGIRGKWAPAANDLANPSKTIPNLSVVKSGNIGDIVSFNNPRGLGHTTLKLGPGLLIYAGEFGVKVGSFSSVMGQDYALYTIRRYKK